MKMKTKATAVCLGLCVLLGLLCACGNVGRTELVPIVEVSEEFSMPGQETERVEVSQPFVTPEPEAEEVETSWFEKLEPTESLTQYFLSGGTVLSLPEGFERLEPEEGYEFLLRNDRGVLIRGARMTRAEVEEAGIPYPATTRELGDMLMDLENFPDTAGEDAYGSFRVELYGGVNGEEHLYYSVFVRGDVCCWEVDFVCPADMADEYRERFAYWASRMELADKELSGDTVTFVSEAGQYTMEIPREYSFLTEKMEEEDFLNQGFDEEMARFMLQYLETLKEEMSAIDILVYTEDFYGYFYVVVAPTELTQADMTEDRDAFCEELAAIYEETGVPEEEIIDIGVGYIEDKPDAFARVHSNYDGTEMWQYLTVHEEAGHSITITFGDMLEEDIESIMRSFELVRS